MGACTENVYFGIDTIELAVFDAVANYNYGRKATLDIFGQLNTIPGVHTIRICNILNLRRKYTAAHHNTPATKKRRKMLRGEKKKKTDKHVMSEGRHMNQVVFSWILGCFLKKWLHKQEMFIPFFAFFQIIGFCKIINVYCTARLIILQIFNF